MPHLRSPRILIILAVMLFPLIIVGLVFLTVSKRDSAPVGVILAGPASDYGWGGKVSDDPYSETSVNGQSLIFFTHFNSAGIPLETVIQTLRDRGAQVICLSPGTQAASTETALAGQFPDTTFIFNLASYNDINHLMPRLGTLRHTPGSTRDLPKLTLLILLFLLGMVVLLPAVLVLSRRSVRTAKPSRNVLERLIERVSKGDKPKKKRLAESSLHLRRLAIQDAAEQRKTIPQDKERLMLHRLTTYIRGDNEYDESFSIEAPNLGEFLGECGVNIAARVNTQDSEKVSALEMWLFDKKDIRTTSGVLMSPYLFQNETGRGKLRVKGEAVEAVEDALLVLDTAGITLHARVVSTQPGYDPALPPNSFFEHLVLELIVWRTT